jgi:Phosphopantetheine attachment site.
VTTTTVTEEDVFAEMDRQIHKLLPHFTGEITPASSFEEMELDSLTRVDLLAAMELAFDIEVPDDEVVKIVKAQDLADLVLSLRTRA